ncbi:MAG: hypothetical protein P1U89_15605 [Verrucomicrobiales bacterium]|nr:hypothetical protein [Verrucomicrobiales bacterium]
MNAARTTLFFLPVYFLLISLCPVLAEESGGGWSKSGMIKFTDLYIRKVREELPGRVERVQQQLEIPLSLDYQIPIEIEPYRESYQHAVSGKMGEARSLQFLSDVLKDMSKVAKPIFKAESKAMQAWKKEKKARSNWTMIPPNQNSNNEGYRSEEVFGTMVEARNLGVVLDISPSMAPYLSTVRNEISEKFPRAVYVETEGSFVLENDVNRWWWAEPSGAANPFQPLFFHDPIEVSEPHQAAWDAMRDAGAAILAMAEFGGLDAIYWFTDLDDPYLGMAEFCERLEKNGVKIYVHLQKGRAPSELGKLANSSGGIIESKVKPGGTPVPKPSPPSTMSTTSTPTPPSPPQPSPSEKTEPPIAPNRSLSLLKDIEFEFQLLHMDDRLGDAFQTNFSTK